MPTIRPIATSALILTLIVALGACKTHRIDIQQGNLLTDKEIGQITPGMSKREVRYILGTPLIVDPFHQDRWDYFYSLDTRQGHITQRRVTLVFSEDKLDRIEGTKEGHASDGDESGGTVITESQREEKGFFKKTWDKIWPGGDE